MDIVERLRDTTGIHEELIYEAADEIERLREALKRVELRSGETHIVDLACSALQQNGSE